MYTRAMRAASIGFGAYNMYNGGRKMYEGAKSHDGDKVFGGSMQFYQGVTGPVMAGGSLAAKAVHFATTSSARYMSRNERQEMQQNVGHAASYVSPSIFK